jgi:hypothetical protein
MGELHRFVHVRFDRFKAFETFELRLRQFNILVGPNNAGKSTILAAFRILYAGLRRARARNAQPVRGPNGMALGYPVELSGVSIAEENIFYNYDDSQPAEVRFTLSNGSELLLYFPAPSSCFLFLSNEGPPARTPTTVKTKFNCPIGFVPILGPVDHHEHLYGKEAARLALFNYQAARNFRNIWHHYPERFDEFRAAVRRTWPGMDIDPPVVDTSYSPPRLHMFCPEERRPREIFWSGFGFQVWCQMLTHVIQSGVGCSIFLIDEPDIYLHADLQRQLLAILRSLGPDVVLATHSTDMISDAEPDDIVVINKRARGGRRIRHPSQLTEVFSALGSNLNPILTQLAKTRRVVFVEGKDFQIISRFAAKLGTAKVAARSEFAVVPAGGFSPSRIRDLKRGMETTLGGEIRAAAVFDRDYRSAVECSAIHDECAEFCQAVVVHQRKEIENFLLVPSAIDRAAVRRLNDRRKRTNKAVKYVESAAQLLMEFAAEKKSYVAAQVLDSRRRFERAVGSPVHSACSTEEALKEFEHEWKNPPACLDLVPGKEALSAINRHLQGKYEISVTPTGIIDAMGREEIPEEMKRLVDTLEIFGNLGVGA